MNYLKSTHHKKKFIYSWIYWIKKLHINLFRWRTNFTKTFYRFCSLAKKKNHFQFLIAPGYADLALKSLKHYRLSKFHNRIVCFVSDWLRAQIWAGWDRKSYDYNIEMESEIFKESTHRTNHHSVSISIEPNFANKNLFGNQSDC